ncbi:MAG: hypothetical protein WA971_03445, partial [Microbacterium sp.]
RLAVTGPAPGPFALAIGLEVLVGAAILLLAPRHRDELAEERTDRWYAEQLLADGRAAPEAPGAGAVAPAADSAEADSYPTAPID